MFPDPPGGINRRLTHTNKTPPGQSRNGVFQDRAIRVFLIAPLLWCAVRRLIAFIRALNHEIVTNHCGTFRNQRGQSLKTIRILFLLAIGPIL